MDPNRYEFFAEQVLGDVRPVRYGIAVESDGFVWAASVGPSGKLELGDRLATGSRDVMLAFAALRSTRHAFRVLEDMGQPAGYGGDAAIVRLRDCLRDTAQREINWRKQWRDA